jgi:hypothetical protein
MFDPIRLLAWMLLAGLALAAESWKPGDLEDNVTRSVAIVDATVVRAREAVEPGRPLFEVTITERWPGRAPGGDELDPEHRVIHVTPPHGQLSRGQRYLLYLAPRPRELGEFAVVHHERSSQRHREAVHTFVYTDGSCPACSVGEALRSMQELEERMRRFQEGDFSGDDAPAPETAACRFCGRPLRDGIGTCCQTCAVARQVCRQCGAPYEPDVNPPDEDGVTIRPVRVEPEELEVILEPDDTPTEISPTATSCTLARGEAAVLAGLDPAARGDTWELMVEGDSLMPALVPGAEGPQQGLDPAAAGTSQVLIYRRDEPDHGYYLARRIEVVVSAD